MNPPTAQHSHQTQPLTFQLDWVDALKAMALVGIILVHLVEIFGPGPWFTNPSDSWGPLEDRLKDTPFLEGEAIWIGIIRLFGWLGDSGPGVFILLSGLGLTLSALKRKDSFTTLNFLQKRLLRIYPLYIAAHILILGMALFFPFLDYSFAVPETLMSLVGYRFLPKLFFYINPSWWFIWCILQLYLLYPQ